MSATTLWILYLVSVLLSFAVLSYDIIKSEDLTVQWLLLITCYSIMPIINLGVILILVMVPIADFLSESDIFNKVIIKARK